MSSKHFILLLYILLIGISCRDSCDKNTVVEAPLLLSFFCGENYSDEEVCIRKRELGITYNTIEYPKEARENNIEGIVVVKFLVDIYGVPIDLEIKTGIGYGCDEEAMEFVQNLNYEPAKNECGDNIVSDTTYDVEFEIQ